MCYRLPPTDKLSILPHPQLTETLGHLFEPCQTLSSLLILKVFSKNCKYATYTEMIESCRNELMQYLNAAELEAKCSGTPIDPDISKIIAAHPRLGRSKVNKTENLSSHSSEEQKSVQASSDQEAFKLSELNEKYEATFPGLRYVVFVNGRPRSVIMKNMVERIERNDISKERLTAFNAICDIALDRAKS